MSKPTPVAVVDRVFNSVGLLHATVEEGKLSEGDALYPSSALQALEEENELLRTCGVAELAARNPNAMSWIEHWEGRATAAEAELESRTRELDEEYAIAKELEEALAAMVASCTSSPTPMSEGNTRIVSAPSRDALVAATAVLGKIRAARRFMEESR